MNPLPHDYQSGALVHSDTQLLAFQEWKLGFIKMFKDKPLLISVPRALLSCCTVLELRVRPRFFDQVGHEAMYGGCMHLVEINTFSLNHVIVRHVKIMKRANKNWAQF